MFTATEIKAKFEAKNITVLSVKNYLGKVRVKIAWTDYMKFRLDPELSNLEGIDLVQMKA